MSARLFLSTHRTMLQLSLLVVAAACAQEAAYDTSAFEAQAMDGGSASGSSCPPEDDEDGSGSSGGTGAGSGPECPSHDSGDSNGNGSYYAIANSQALCPGDVAAFTTSCNGRWGGPGPDTAAERANQACIDNAADVPECPCGCEVGEDATVECVNVYKSGSSTVSKGGFVGWCDSALTIRKYTYYCVDRGSASATGTVEWTCEG
jgi:hypothetical protein